MAADNSHSSGKLLSRSKVVCELFANFDRLLVARVHEVPDVAATSAGEKPFFAEFLVGVNVNQQLTWLTARQPLRLGHGFSTVSSSPSHWTRPTSPGFAGSNGLSSRGFRVP